VGGQRQGIHSGWGGEGVHPLGHPMGEGQGGVMRDVRSVGGEGTTKDGAAMVIDLSSPLI
jgi:hypothetical protein